MKPFKVLIYEDEDGWVDGFKFILVPRLAAEDVKLVVLHRTGPSSLMQDLEWLPDLIIVDHDLDLDPYFGNELITQIDGDPQFKSLSIYYCSGGESIESLRKFVKDLKGAIYCYTKQGDELGDAVFAKGKTV